MKNYVGDFLQVRGAEQYILQNGKGDGMHFLYIRNGLGLECWISLDRGGDVSRLNFKGDNMGFYSPCGYVSPQYYDGVGAGFLKSFTAGFFTTCGLSAVGAPCNDEGEELPLHGTVSHIPAVLNGIEEDNDCLTVKLTVSDKVIFGRKLVMKRVYKFSYTQNSFTVTDNVTNEGDEISPFMLLYHCNMGYPLLKENSIVRIPNNSVMPRDREAEKHTDTAIFMEKPQACFKERCYYYDIAETGGLSQVGIFSPDINKGMIMSYKKEQLPCFTQWKMMGKTDYVLGLEPGNCNPDGRDVLRKNGKLKFLEPDCTAISEIKFSFTENIKYFNEF